MVVRAPAGRRVGFCGADGRDPLGARQPNKTISWPLSRPSQRTSQRPAVSQPYTHTHYSYYYYQ